MPVKNVCLVGVDLVRSKEVFLCPRKFFRVKLPDEAIKVEITLPVLPIKGLQIHALRRALFELGSSSEEFGPLVGKKKLKSCEKQCVEQRKRNKQ